MQGLSTGLLGVVGQLYLHIMSILMEKLHPKLCALLKGVFNKRPPQPQYVFIWDVQIVINYIKSEWGYSEGPSDKLLALKFVMLMTLTLASRVSAIHHLGVRYIVKGNGKCVFKFHRLHKIWRCGKPIPSLEFH